METRQVPAEQPVQSPWNCATSLDAKILTLCLNDRLNDLCRQVMDQENAGFRTVRSCDDIGFATRHMVEDYVRMPPVTQSPYYDVYDDNDLYIH